jgi:SAM-dependent methyltransferase
MDEGGHFLKSHFIEAFKRANITLPADDNLSALDIGCGDTLNLSFLHHKGFNKLDAVDLKPIELREYEDYKNRNRIINLRPLQDYISLFEDGYEEYFNRPHEMFNVIILSNFLHLFAGEKIDRKIIQSCIERLKLMA